MRYARSHLAARMLVLCCLLVAAIAGSAHAATTPVSNFSKVGTNEATGSSTAGGSTATAHAGDTIDWVLSYRNKTGQQANVNITDPITGNQSFVPGSLKTPPGLDPQWSTDGGSTWLTSEPNSGVNGVGAKGVSADGSTGPQTLFTAPAQSFNAGNSQGDGWEALFVGDNIYNVHHHTPTTGAATLLDCHDKNTGAQCPGYPVDFVDADAGTPFGSGTSTLTNPTYTNAAVEADGDIFIPVGSLGDPRYADNSIGVLCIDLTGGASCGYTELGHAKFTNLDGGPGIAGGAQIGNSYYVIGASDGAPVYCYDITTQAACAGWPAAGVPSDPAYAPAANTWFNAFAMDAYGPYVFPTIKNNDGTVDLGCIDTTTGARCPGFPIAGVSSTASAGTIWSGVAPTLDASGNVTGICAQSGTADVTTAYKCYDVTSGAFTGGAPFDQMVPNAGVGYTNLSAALQIGSRLYFDYVAGGNPNGQVTYTCYDFASSSACPGFTPVNGGTSVRPYTIRRDPFNKDCIWELGDAGVFQVFSATFGGSLGCNEGNATVSVTPDAFYCDNQPGHVTAWDRLRLSGVTASDFDAVAVTITDSNGDVVPGWDHKVVPSNQVPIDISSIPYAGSTKSLNIEMVISWGSHAVVPGTAVDATFTGDAPQVCYQTKVGPASCAAAHTLNNQASAVTDVPGGPSDAPSGNDSQTATFNEPADPDLCKWDLGVVKKALKSPLLPGTDEPYDITVTNYGPDTATPVTVKDTLPTGMTYVSGDSACSASGSVVTCSLSSLAANTSRTFRITAHVASTVKTALTNPVVACADKADVGPAPTKCDPLPPCSSSTSCDGMNCSSAQPAAKTRATDAHPNTDCVTVPFAPHLRLSKTVSRATVRAGQTLTYTIKTTNPSDITITNVKTCDDLPNGLAYVSSTPKAKLTRGQYCWTLKSLAPHKSKTYKIKVRALNGAPRHVVNPAVATADNALRGTAKRRVRVLGSATKPAVTG